MTGSRARSIDELNASLGRFVTAEGRRRASRFRPRASDVIIATYPKCGTTWLQQIVHALRSDASMDFPEITAVVPWLELSHDMGVDPDAPQVAHPRAFKSHLSFDDVPKGARYVNAVRDPGDALLSLYRFFDGWRMEPGAITLESFAFEFYLRREGGRDDPSVLLLCYENMLQDPSGTVRRIAHFIGVDADATLLERVLTHSSLQFMKRHESQFDDHLVREARDAACGLPPGLKSTKVASGRTGDSRRVLSTEVREALAAAWCETITPETGLEDYAALRNALEQPCVDRDSDTPAS
jgi:hypothetical protein